MSEGLRQQSDGVIHVQIVDGYQPRDLSGYVVTATARFVNGTIPFDVTVTPDDAVTGRYQLFFSGLDLTAADDLAVELYFDATPIVNPNPKAILVHVRALYDPAP